MQKKRLKDGQIRIKEETEKAPKRWPDLD